ncbi:unnamed protein product, partial [Iphiclides podalirius]
RFQRRGESAKKRGEGGGRGKNLKAATQWRVVEIGKSSGARRLRNRSYGLCCDGDERLVTSPPRKCIATPLPPPRAARALQPRSSRASCSPGLSIGKPPRRGLSPGAWVIRLSRGAAPSEMHPIGCGGTFVSKSARTIGRIEAEASESTAPERWLSAYRRF